MKTKREKIVKLFEDTGMIDGLIGKHVYLSDIIDRILAIDDEWVSVEDELPPKDVSVIIYNGIEVFTAEYTDQGWYDMEDGVFLASDFFPLYWMPLPEPPKTK